MLWRRPNLGSCVERLVHVKDTVAVWWIAYPLQNTAWQIEAFSAASLQMECKNFKSVRCIQARIICRWTMLAYAGKHYRVFYLIARIYFYHAGCHAGSWKQQTILLAVSLKGKISEFSRPLEYLYFNRPALWTIRCVAEWKNLVDLKKLLLALSVSAKRFSFQKSALYLLWYLLLVGLGSAAVW